MNCPSHNSTSFLILNFMVYTLTSSDGVFWRPSPSPYRHLLGKCARHRTMPLEQLPLSYFHQPLTVPGYAIPPIQAKSFTVRVTIPLLGYVDITTSVNYSLVQSLTRGHAAIDQRKGDWGRQCVQITMTQGAGVLRLVF